MKTKYVIVTQMGNDFEVQNEAGNAGADLIAQGYLRRDAQGCQFNPEWPFFWAILYEKKVLTLREAVKEFVDELHLSPKVLQKHLIAISDAYDREGEEK